MGVWVTAPPMGRIYDKALENLMKALDTPAKANDANGAASASESIGRIFMNQGRLGAAVGAMQDSRERIPLRKEQECGLGRVFE